MIAFGGSSPRVRGTRGCPAGRPWLSRFIPACAGNTNDQGGQILLVGVHPRVCGEHLQYRSPKEFWDGSSPRVRGTRSALRTGPVAARFIPACAGNTPLHGIEGTEHRFIPACAGNTYDVGPDRHASAVHPRVCGEHVPGYGLIARPHGSSPRVRGTHDRSGDDRRTVRFIPACAGNTRGRHPGDRSAPVHPRVCGEHKSVARPSAPRCGSSPRVRGTLLGFSRSLAQVRFIPACAGNTHSLERTVPHLTVHPRVCGEHTCCLLHETSRCGSSPRVRGTPCPANQSRQELDDNEGSSPRVRGTRTLSISCRSPVAVHPRVCGEHSSLHLLSSISAGSSPRVRGTRSAARNARGHDRFIPACAGNTTAAPPTPPSGAVHPRVCGEHSNLGILLRAHIGSSPRVRGTPP